MRWPLGWRPFAVAATIATLLIFPLINALTVDHGHLLHWRTEDTLETFGAWSMLLLTVWVTIGLPAAFALLKTAEGINALWLLAGGFFFFGAVVRAGAVHEFAARHRVASPAVAVMLVVSFAALVAALLLRVHRNKTRPIERSTLILSPLVLVFFFQLAQAQRYHREPHFNALPVSGSSDLLGSTSPQRIRTVILLFDELSPNFLYGDNATALNRLPTLKRLVAESNVYSGAYLPGGATRNAIPALFGQAQFPYGQTSGQREQGREVLPVRVNEGWLRGSVGQGLDVRVFGWYLDYCVEVASTASACTSVSLYNPRTLGGGVSFIHPLWTTLNLLPADMPFGLAKLRPALRLHQATYAAAMTWMLAQLADDRADIVYVHVNVPHVPFLAADLSGRDRFVVTRDRYVEQLRYVDAFLADALGAMAPGDHRVRPSRLIVMSDHNVRALTLDSKHEEIVFIVRPPKMAGGTNDRRRVNAAELVSVVLSGTE